MSRHFHQTALLVAAALFVSLANPAVAEANLRITEVYSGIVGEDGSADWIEITNFGTSAFDLADLRINGLAPRNGPGQNEPGVRVVPSQVKVIVMGITAGGETDAISAFEDLWGPGLELLFTTGSSLDETGDTVTLQDALGNTLDQVTFTTADTSAGLSLATLDTVARPIAASRLNVNGAYESAAFFNDTLGLPGDQATLIGSPGLVPEPTSLVLLSLGTLALGCRRRTR